MPRKCSVCSREDRPQIDAEISAGTPYRNISEKFGPSIAAISRHRAHITLRTDTRTHTVTKGEPTDEDLEKLRRHLSRVKEPTVEEIRALQALTTMHEYPVIRIDALFPTYRDAIESELRRI